LDWIMLLGMPRIPRIAVPGIAMHVVQRGNNRQAVFFHDTDHVSYLELLFESAERYDVSVHAFVCMTNHVHILLTPWSEGTASRMMQRLGASYTAGINSIYRRTGSLWEGRFKSSLVDSKRYVLACYRYIELNPVRAGIVDRPSDYRWSSYRHHAVRLGKYPIRPHPEWLALGSNAEKRRQRYAALVADGLQDDEVQTLRRCARKGLPAGSKCFRAEIERALGRRMGDGQRGRPRKGL
jgi:putative transposase